MGALHLCPLLLHCWVAMLLPNRALTQGVAEGGVISVSPKEREAHWNGWHQEYLLYTLGGMLGRLLHDFCPLITFRCAMPCSVLAVAVSPSHHPHLPSHLYPQTMHPVSNPISLTSLLQLLLLHPPWCSLQFIGSLEISRPSSKLDIITAMRRIRVSAS